MDPILKEILERFSDGVRGQRSREAMKGWLRGHDTAELLLIQDNWEWPRERMAKDLLDEELERRRMGQWEREIGGTAEVPVAQTGGLDKGAVQTGGLDKGAVQSRTRRSTPSGAIRPGEAQVEVAAAPTPIDVTPARSAETRLSPLGIPMGGTANFEIPPVEMRAGGLGGRAVADEALVRGSGTAPIKGDLGRAIIIHRQEILESGPGLRVTINEILDWYDQNRPNDRTTQRFVDRLKTLSKELDAYLAILQAEPTERKAERAGKSLFKKVLSAIKAFEKTTTGNMIVRLAACGTLLGLAAIAAPIVSPYLTVPLITACVFPEETKVATSLFKVVEGLARKVGVLPSKSED